MKICSIPDCDRPTRALAMCEMHYLRDRRARAAKTRAANQRAEQAERLDELAWLLDGGVWPPHAARRCGWTVTGAEKAAREQGRDSIRQALTPFVREARVAA